MEVTKNEAKTAEFEERARKLVAQMTLEEKAFQMVYQAPAIERLGVKAYNWWNEALHGVARAGVATVFPQALREEQNIMYSRNSMIRIFTRD